MEKTESEKADYGCVMRAQLLDQKGLPSALYGMGLSFGLTSAYDDFYTCPLDLQGRLLSIATGLAPKINGEGKVCEHVMIWLKVTGPRYWWQEADTYRLASKQSESTMHTLKKEIGAMSVSEIMDTCETSSCCREQAAMVKDAVDNNRSIEVIKRMIPEGFIQTREWVMSLSEFRRIILQRRKHRLPHWRMFIRQVLSQLGAGEFHLAASGFEIFKAEDV